MKRIPLMVMVALLLGGALAQAPVELFVFRPGTPIKADEVNANFQLLRDDIARALGLTDLTGEEVAELTAFLVEFQGLLESGQLDGASIEFAWDGTRLGVRLEGEEEFRYTDLRGEVGPQGLPGPGLEFDWQGTTLGVRAAGTADFVYVDLGGPAGPEGPVGPQGLQGEPGPAGAQGEVGPAGAVGPAGPAGVAGPAGPAGPAGSVGPTGPAGPQGPAGPTGDTGPMGPMGPMGPTGPAGSDAPIGIRFGRTYETPTTGGAAGECTMGDVWLAAGRWAGAGVPAHGQLLSISGYSALFAVIGTMYGGDGTTTFALPDLRDAEPKSRNGWPLTYMICVQGTYPAYPW